MNKIVEATNKHIILAIRINDQENGINNGNMLWEDTCKKNIIQEVKKGIIKII